jgi:hypothetical protein
MVGNRAGCLNCGWPYTDLRLYAAEEKSYLMQWQWPEFLAWPVRRSGIVQPIDLGNNRFLSPEDVLDGHFRRLSSRTVKIQVENDLQAAITVLAPGLAPLTELASEVAGVVPQVQPDAQFRQDLHRALELTHRQHTAQRKLGTQAEEPPSLLWHSMLAASLAMLVFAAFVVYLRGHRKLAQA